jgi:hypothetical protein
MRETFLSSGSQAEKELRLEALRGNQGCQKREWSYAGKAAWFGAIFEC